MHVLTSSSDSSANGVVVLPDVLLLAEPIEQAELAVGVQSPTAVPTQVVLVAARKPENSHCRKQSEAARLDVADGTELILDDAILAGRQLLDVFLVGLGTLRLIAELVKA